MQHTQTNINFYLDETDKKDMEQVCSQLGLSMSAAFTFLQKRLQGKNAFRLNYHLTRSILKAILVILKE